MKKNVVIAPLSGPTRLVNPNQIWDACLIFVFTFYLFVFFLSVVTRIPRSTLMVDPNRSPVYSDIFHLSYQNILFMSFHFSVFSYAKAVLNVRPINIYFYTISLQNGLSCLYKMIYKTLFQRFTILFTKYHMFKRNDMHMTGYILIRHNFLYDSTLLDLAFFPVYSKPAHR